MSRCSATAHTALACFFLFCLDYSQAQTCLTPPSGMVAWYPGDGNATDFLGVNNGAFQNGATYVSGKVGPAFAFNGADQFVALPANFLPYPVAGGQSSAALSVDAWFQTIAGGVILGQQGGLEAPAEPNGSVPAIYVGADGMLYAELFWGGTVNPVSSTPRKVNDGQFHHVAVTYDGATEQVYLDGVLLNSVPFTQTGYAPNYHYQIGTGYTRNWPAGNGGYYYFQGLIDEVEFFGRALSIAEVQAIFNAGSAGKCKNFPISCAAPPQGMTAWFTGDGTADDLLGLHNAAFQNAAFAPGKVGQAFSLNGSQFVALPANFLSYPGPAQTSVAPVSVDAWFQTAGAGVILGQQGGLAPPDVPNGAVPAIYVGTDGVLYAELFWGGAVAPLSSAPRTVNDGVFHHVAVTYDGTAETLYLDGALVGSAPFTQTGYASAYQYQLGAGYTANWPAANGGYFYFQGLIDEVEFFSRALSLGEVQDIFAAGSTGKCKSFAPVAKCRNMAVPAGPGGSAAASIDDGSFSPVPGRTITLSQAPPGPYSLGDTLVTLTATDSAAAASQCTGTVTVFSPGLLPCGSPLATPSVLWPPNGKMVPVTVGFGGSGDCPAASCKILSVYSNEGNRVDWVITGDLTVNLRAARSGGGDGRVYTIVVQCADASGGLSTGTVTVMVPHDQGKHGGGKQ